MKVTRDAFERMLAAARGRWGGGGIEALRARSVRRARSPAGRSPGPGRRRWLGPRWPGGRLRAERRALRELRAVHRVEQAELLLAAARLAAERALRRAAGSAAPWALAEPAPALAGFRRRLAEERAAARADRVRVPRALARLADRAPAGWGAPLALVAVALELAPSDAGRLLAAELCLVEGDASAALATLAVLWERGVPDALAARFLEALAAARELAGEPGRALAVLARLEPPGPATAPARPAATRPAPAWSAPAPPRPGPGAGRDAGPRARPGAWLCDVAAERGAWTPGGPPRALPPGVVVPGAVVEREPAASSGAAHAGAARSARRLVATLALALETGAVDAAQRAAAGLERLDLARVGVAAELERALAALVARRAARRASPSARGAARAARAACGAARELALEWAAGGGPALARTCRAVL